MSIRFLLCLFGMSLFISCNLFNKAKTLNLSQTGLNIVCEKCTSLKVENARNKFYDVFQDSVAAGIHTEFYHNLNNSSEVEFDFIIPDTLNSEIVSVLSQNRLTEIDKISHKVLNDDIKQILEKNKKSNKKFKYAIKESKLVNDDGVKHVRHSVTASSNGSTIYFINMLIYNFYGCTIFLRSYSTDVNSLYNIKKGMRQP